MFPKINGLKIKCLWDTGAARSLVRTSTAKQLQARGAKWTELDRPTSLIGIGEGSVPSLGRLEMTLTLKDGKPRKIAAHICDKSPYDLIIGVDFMQDEELGCFPHAKGIDICDMKTKKVIERFPDLSTAARVCLLEPPPLSAQQRQERYRQTVRERRNRKAWASLQKESREVADLLSTVRLTEAATAEKIQAAWNKVETAQFTCETIVCCTVEEPCQDHVPKRTAPITVKTDFPEIHKEVNELVQEFEDVFSATASDVGKSRGETVEIRLKSKVPVNVKNYRTPLKLREVMKALLDELLKAGVIERCSSDYNSPCLLVAKKDEGGKTAGYRLVIDYRMLNKVIESIVYPMPRIQDILCSFAGCTVFSVMDIRHAYYTIRIDDKSKKLTAFSCELGKFVFNFLPQGLSISPAIFMERIYRDLEAIPRTTPFMDDISLATPTPAEHVVILRKIFQKMRSAGYKLKLSKCELAREKVTFTGMDASAAGVHVSDSKKNSVKKLVPPRTVSDCQSLLGFVSFLRAHVPYYCDIVGPIQTLTRMGPGRADVTEGWTPTHDVALQTLKDLLLDEQVLAYPNPNIPYELFTDASSHHMSGVLMQRDEQKHRRPIGYWSKGFKGSQLLWSALVKEARAIREAVKHFDVFIRGCEVVVRCDHKPLAKFFTSTTANAMANRWSLEMMEYNLTFEWVSTTENLSDCLSRTVVRDELVEKGLYKKHDPAAIGGEFPEKAIVRSDNDETTSTKKGKAEKVVKEGVVDPQILQIQVLDSTQYLTCAELDVMLAEVPRHEAIPKEELEKLISDNMQIVDGRALTMDRFRDMQRKDQYVKRIRAKYLDEEAVKSKKNGEFREVEGILYKHVWEVAKGKQILDTLALVIPNELVLTVIANTHQELIHPGRDKMIAALSRKVYWKSMRKDINQYTIGCEECVIKTLKLPEYRNLGVPPAKKPMDRIALDCWSPNKNSAALTGLCLHSQYPFVVPMKDKTAESVIRAAKSIFAMGNPKEVLTDNGPEFTAEVFKKFLEDEHISHVRTTKYSPQTNGQVERFHGFLNACLRINMDLAEGDWERATEAAVVAYRKLPHTSTGESPLFLMTGREPTLDIDHLLPTLGREVWSDQGQLDTRMMQNAYALARKNAAQARLKHQMEVGNPPPNFKEGQAVYKRKMVRSKIDPAWDRDYVVRSVLKGGRTILVENTRTGKRERVNARHLRARDPLMELLRNSKIDTVPGRSKLFMRADDLANLRWPAVSAAPRISPEDLEVLKETVRNRARDKQEQQHKRTSESEKTEKTSTAPMPAGDESGEEEGEVFRPNHRDGHVSEEEKDETTTRRSGRQRTRTRKLDDYVTGCVENSVRLNIFHDQCGHSK